MLWRRFRITVRKDLKIKEKSPSNVCGYNGVL